MACVSAECTKRTERALFPETSTSVCVCWESDDAIAKESPLSVVVVVKSCEREDTTTDESLRLMELLMELAALVSYKDKRN